LNAVLKHESIASFILTILIEEIHFIQLKRMIKRSVRQRCGVGGVWGEATLKSDCQILKGGPMRRLAPSPSNFVIFVRVKPTRAKQFSENVFKFYDRLSSKNILN
jgi:hypothetical protein